VIIDARQLEVGRRLETDICIVGSGAAGITTAMELARSGWDVMVLEAGGTRAEQDLQDPCRGVLEPGTDHDPLDLVRQRRLGGTTNQWGGRCAPLQRLDFEHRSWLPGSGWPIGLDQLRPFYERAHAYCQLGLFEYTADQALPGADPFISGSRHTLLEDSELWRWSPPVNFWRRYKGALDDAPNVRVIYHAYVTRLDRDPVGGAVERAVVSASPGRGFEVAAKVFVVAAGGLESARLLLASNAQTQAGLGNEHDLVGRFYMTHPVAEVGQLELTDPGAMSAAGGFQLTRDSIYCRRMIRLRDAVHQDHDLLNLAGALWYPEPGDPGHEDPLLSTFALVRAGMARTRLDWKSAGVHKRYESIEDVPGHLANVARGLPSVGGYAAMWARRRWLAQRALPSFMPDPGTGPMRLRFDAEQSPEADNRVTLSRERDAYGVPRLTVGYRVSSSDRDSIKRALTVLGLEIERLGAAQVDFPTETTDLDEVELGDGTHQLGLTRMGDTPRRGVVDRGLRVHGAENLRVVSSSVFPTSGAVGPTLTIVALAIRAAQDIAGELSGRTPLAVDLRPRAEAPP